MNITTSGEQKLADKNRRAHVERILRDYPDISDSEAAEVLLFLKSSTPIEVGLVTANDALGPKVQQFRDDHASEFSLGWKEYLMVAAILIALVAMCFFLWDTGKR